MGAGNRGRDQGMRETCLAWAPPEFVMGPKGSWSVPRERQHFVVWTIFLPDSRNRALRWCGAR